MPRCVVPGRAYAVLRVYSTADDAVQLVQLHNAWGQRKWTGAWCEGDAMWSCHPAVRTRNPCSHTRTLVHTHTHTRAHTQVAEALGQGQTGRPTSRRDKRRDREESSFWMSFADFLRVFNSLVVVRLLGEEWMMQRREAEWGEDTAGGCINHLSWR